MDTENSPLQEVQPVKYDRRENRTTKQPYTFDKVHIDEVDLDKININDVVTEKQLGAILWRYEGKPHVIIRKDVVRASSHANTQEAQRQAFFALSALESNAWVSGWRKR